jgi:hypothetical protein
MDPLLSSLRFLLNTINLLFIYLAGGTFRHALTGASLIELAADVFKDLAKESSHSVMSNEHPLPLKEGLMEVFFLNLMKIQIRSTQLGFY